ncbi:dTMP kinase [Alsobacter sp. SYSU M60028]|uniref:Thymidylate kinase n=1 Tax=Alsobacter ponti TaxID=2962936 RepID=A0ABT1LHY7_9HYPH|nr:dTMP kinase [Alsobacter ponti]MCP8941114.1 dTMP kinase [Alsobacter ponti]
MTQARRGRFVTLEGGEGAGKSTQIRRLAARLAERGVAVVATREPGGSPRAEEIRAVILSGSARRLGPLAEALLFAAARADHLDVTIRPALARGAWVVCDRFFDSTRAYQGARGGVDASVLAALDRIVVGETRPDLTLVLDLPAELGLARAHARRGAAEPVDRFEAEDLAFHEALRRDFLAIAAAEPARCVVVDASGGEDEVAEAVWRAVESRLLAGETA